MKDFRFATVRIPLIYAIFSLLWISFTDQLLLALVPDIGKVTQWQTYKGWLFVCLSSLIIYWLVARSARQHRAVQSALTHSEELYRLLFNNNPLPMWVYDSTSLAFLEVNDAAVAQYQFSRAEFLALTIKDIRPAEDVPALLTDVLETIEPLNFAGEWRHCRKDGTVFPVDISSHILKFNGRSARLVVAKDLTQQKQLEAEHAHVFERNQSLVAALGEIVYEWFPACGEVKWEGDYGRILGYTAEEMGHTTVEWQEKIHPKDQARVAKEMAAAVASRENLEIEYRFLQKDGTYRWMLDRGVLQQNSQGELEKVVGVFLDVHARKLAEEALRESEDRFRKAIEFAPFPIMIHVEDGDVLAVSQTWLDITGYTPEEISTVAKWTECAYGPEQARVMAGVDQLYALDERVDEGEFVILCKDGTQRVWEFSSTPLGRFPDGRRGVISIAVDVTERRSAEKEREQLHRQERLAAIGQLAAGIAHDFNNLMAVVMLYSQLLGHSPRLTQKERGQIQTITQQAQRATRLIEQILDFSRRAVFERQPIDLLLLLKEEVKLLERTLPENIAISLVHESENFVIQADETRIQQTIMNLAFNARDAMPDGGTLRFELAHLDFTVKDEPPLPTMQPGNWIHLAVSDTGTGIDPAVFEHIFEPFATTKQPGKGTGLGLSQVHGIVAQHEGFISVASGPGEGARFDIYLPALILSTNDVVEEVLGTAVLGQGERLLVVEDEPALREALVESLSLWQYEVLVTADGEEALALLQQGTAVDLIISDVVMPKMGGVPFVQALRALEQDIPVIFITGHPLDIELETLHSLGVSSILSKPIQPDHLSLAVSTALNHTSSHTAA